VNELVLYDFLKHFEQLKSEELNKIQYEHQVISEDCKKVEEILNDLKAKPILIANSNRSQPDKVTLDDHESGEQLVSSNDSQTSDSVPKSTLTESSSNDLQTNESVSSQIDLVELSPNSKNLQLILANKKIIVHRHFDELTQIYVHSHDKDLKDFNVKISSTESVVDKMRKTVNTLTKFRDIQCVASVNYNSDFTSTSNIVSSVDFNKTYEHFAVAGVTKRIKIFDFLSILDRPIRIHYPILEMNHNAKLSCLNWNRYFGNQLACSDYDGVVTLWDADVGTLTKSLQEHEKRCWSVQFCDVDPRLLASASDDSKVKIWSTNNQYSLLSIDAKSNVCCAVFKPDSKFHVLLGTADHSIHYYDLRNTKEAVSLFTGHTKAVSYVKFLNSHEFVSASTDSYLKMWRLDEGRCVKSYSSHVNEKNFVGLETRDGYILTGNTNQMKWTLFDKS
jgi:E3 ubiquitin-protein ligase RFWD2